MKQRQRHWAGLAAWSIVWGAGLVGCGGDGGDEPVLEPAGTVALTTANRDTAARVAAIGVMALGVSTSVPLADDGAAVALRFTSSAPVGASRVGMASWLPSRVLDTLWQSMGARSQPARSGLRRPLAVYVGPYGCSFSGNYKLTSDDRDNDGQLSVGDVLTFDFNQCQDTPTDVLEGFVTVTITRITSPTAFSARMSMDQLSQEADSGRHGMTLNGAVLLDYVQTSGTAERIALTADGNVVAAVHTHLPFTDTVTLQSGFRQDTAYDSTTGLSSTTMNGSNQSQALGGTVVTSTTKPIVVSDTDTYPSSGVVRVVGSTGEVRLTAVSASEVQIELDAEQNGSFESGHTLAWDQLI